MIDSRVKFRHLQTFVEVARQKSVMCEDKPVRRVDLKVFSANPVLLSIWRYQTGAVSTAGPDFKLVAHRLEAVRTAPLR